MCNCKHSTAIGEEQHTGHCPVDASISVGEGWQTGQDESFKSQDKSYRIAPTSFRNSIHTPPQRIPPVVPDAPLRQRIARIPELAAGVAIVQRRLDFDDPTFDETEAGYVSYGKNYMTSGSEMNQPSYSMRQSTPRETRTSCKKCLRVII